MKHKSFLYLGGAAIILAACGTTSTKAPPVNMLEMGDKVSVVTDSTANTLTLTASGKAPVVIHKYFTGANGTTYLDYNGNVHNVDFNAIHYTVLPDSKAGSASVFFTKPSKGGLNGIQISRNGSATLPTSGSANFTGQYYGTLVTTKDTGTPSNVGKMSDEIRGTVNMAASFGSAPTIQGAITARSPTLSGGTHQNVTLASTPLSSDGTFSGTVTGGSISSITTTSNGTYQGFVTGTSGAQKGLVGGLALTHTIGPTYSAQEYGVFYGQ